MFYADGCRKGYNTMTKFDIIMLSATGIFILIVIIISIRNLIENNKTNIKRNYNKRFLDNSIK